MVIFFSRRKVRSARTQYCIFLALFELVKKKKREEELCKNRNDRTSATIDGRVIDSFKRGGKKLSRYIVALVTTELLLLLLLPIYESLNKF